MSLDSSEHGTITQFLRQLSSGNELVVQQVFDFYFRRLAVKAREHLKKLGGTKLADEEDLASLVMSAFLRDVTAGELGELRSRHDVWRMLSKRLRQRAINLVRDDKRLRKQEVGESVFRDSTGAPEPNGLQNQPGRDINGIEMLHSELLSQLTDSIEVQIASLLFEGYSVMEISERTNKSPATIYRKINRIKEIWHGSDNGDSR